MLERNVRGSAISKKRLIFLDKLGVVSVIKTEGVCTSIRIWEAVFGQLQVADFPARRASPKRPDLQNPS